MSEPNISSAFHNGVLRQAPGDTIPWRQSFAPINLVKGWWLSPVARATVISSWCITFAAFVYCRSLDSYANTLYKNNVLTHRSLMQTIDVNKELEFKVNQLEKELSAKSNQNSKINVNAFDKIRKRVIHASTVENVQKEVNIQIELTREKKRTGELVSIVTSLRKELLDVRTELRDAKHENEKLRKEMQTCKELLKKFTV